MNITNRQKTNGTYGKPSGQLFPKWWLLSSPNRTKSIMNQHKANITETLTPKHRQQIPHYNHRIGTVSNELLGGLKLVLRAKPHPP